MQWYERDIKKISLKFKKVLDKSGKLWYIIITKDKEKEIKKMTTTVYFIKFHFVNDYVETFGNQRKAEKRYKELQFCSNVENLELITKVIEL